MRILKNKIITSLAVASVPLFLTTSAFISKPKEQTPVKVIDKQSQKYNLEVLKSPFQVISQEKKNDNKKKKTVHKTVKKEHKTVKHADVEVQATTQPVVQETSAPVQQSSANTGSAAQQIAMAESSNSYTAQNGKYYGKYQLDISYLHGDLSAANQERTFVQYCNSRYGSVENALAFRQAHNWY